MKQQCRITSTEFTISDKDIEFYQKLGVAHPSLSPQERMRRRLSFRNERNLYRRTCDGTGSAVISMYSPEQEFPVYDNDYWWSDSWDPLAYGREYDFSRPFFDQFFELFRCVPKMARIQQGTMENSKYTNCAGNNKNCYLSFSAGNNEDCLYSNFIDNSRSCIDNFNVESCELAYECVYCTNSYDAHYCQQVHGSNTLRYCFDCRGCDHCIACAGLRNKSYCILNKQVSKDEFNQALNERSKQVALIREWQELKFQVPRLYTDYVNCESFSGSNLKNCKNSYLCWDCRDLEDCSYCSNLRSAKSCYDVDFYGVNGTNELNFECEAVGWGAYHIMFSKLVWGGSAHVCYSYECFSSSDLFGCAGLKKARHCILNKQYSEKDFCEISRRIITQMKETGEWGEFFPAKHSPFPYNMSIAQIFLPLSEQEVTERGLRWGLSENAIANSQSKEQRASTTADESSPGAKDEISCEATGKKFRLIKQEQDFYQKNNLPPPSLSPDVRHLSRVALTNFRELHERSCEACSCSLQSVYPPKAKEKVYCERCYLELIF